MVGACTSVIPLSISNDHHLVGMFKTRKTNTLSTVWSCFVGIPLTMAISWIFEEPMLSVFLLNNYTKMLGWILVTLATIMTLVSCCLVRCCSPLTSLQHCYWTRHLRNEEELFAQAAEQHSRLLIMQRMRKLFGFVPGNKDVKHIRIPTCQDWKDISAPSLLCVGDDSQGHYSFLGGLVDEAEESTPGGIELKPWL